MKWWYFIFLVVGVGIGLFLLKSSFFETKDKPYYLTNMVEDQELVDRLPIKTTLDFDNQEQETVEIVGEVESWVSEEGKLVVLGQGKNWNFRINDLSKTSMMINSLKERGRELLVRDKSSIEWLGGFCKGDQVVARLVGEELIMIVNNGPRSCGFKGN